MSYDILVFDPAHAPREREAFRQWWDEQAEWSEPHPYNDPAFTTPSLRAWFMEMIERFPALSGPYAASPDQRTAPVLHVSAFGVQLTPEERKSTRHRARRTG
jgi:hypothetical protein